ncbi:MAG: recombination regulator RecX [Coriobacteriia bacterium]|nr:recombination regulator RecX [Coriobacteriia bacterium]MCL2536977.1 recombination regulator RecX [Coriobacteriia bacterium]
MKKLSIQNFDELVAGSVASASAVVEPDEAQGREDELYEAARLCAHRIIRRREKTEHELFKRLREKGHDPTSSRQVVERFVEVGLVDNRRYVELYLREAQGSKKGWYRIVRELKQRGISSELLEEFEVPTDDEELQRAALVIERLSVETIKEREKALRKLVARGFSYGVAKTAIAAKTDRWSGRTPQNLHEDGAPFDIDF